MSLVLGDLYGPQEKLCLHANHLLSDLSAQDTKVVRFVDTVYVLLVQV